MTKLLVIPNSIDLIEKSTEIVDAYLIGIENFSIKFPVYFKIEDIPLLLEKTKGKELFVALNKNIHNDELEQLKKILLELEKYKIKAILYYDPSIVNLKDSLKLKHELCWAQEHMTTNYHTINYWYDLGVNYTLLSAEITLKEVIEIRKQTNSRLILPIFGYLTMYASKRRVVKNYLNYFNLEDNSKINYLDKEDAVYPIIDNEKETVVYSANILNGIKAMNEIKTANIDYVVLNSFNISEKVFLEVLTLYRNINPNNVEKTDQTIKKLINNVDTGFLYKSTVYKVKK